MSMMKGKVVHHFNGFWKKVTDIKPGTKIELYAEKVHKLKRYTITQPSTILNKNVSQEALKTQEMGQVASKTFS